MTPTDRSGATPPSPRATVRRHPERAHYGLDTVHAILDEAIVSHVGFVVDGRPMVIPTLHARIGDTLYIHGSAAGRMLTTLAAGAEVCVTATLIDGLVLARSAMHHSINYRSVMLFGPTRVVTDREEKLRALEATVEHAVRGRSRDVRPPAEHELRATSVIALAIDEASAKVRAGGVVEDPADLALPVWAGVIPLSLTPGEPVTDDQGQVVPVPEYASSYRRSGTP